MNFGAVSRERFVDRIVDDFVDEVVQSVGPVEPIYMAGRLRTASSPSKTLIGSRRSWFRWVAAQSSQTLQNLVVLPLIFCLVRFDRNVQKLKGNAGVFPSEKSGLDFTKLEARFGAETSTRPEKDFVGAVEYTNNMLWLRFAWASQHIDSYTRSRMRCVNWRHFRYL